MDLSLHVLMELREHMWINIKERWCMKNTRDLEREEEMVVSDKNGKWNMMKRHFTICQKVCTVGSGSFWPFFAFDLGGPGPISAYGTSQGQKMRVHSVVWCWLHLVTILHCLWDYNMLVSFWNLVCTLVCRVDSSNRVGSVAVAPFYLLLHPQKRMFASLCHLHSVWLTNVASRPQGVPSSTLFRLYQLYQEDMT